MKTKKRHVKMVIISLLLLGFLGGCGSYGYNRRDENGPRRDGSGNGPCAWGSNNAQTTRTTSN